MRIRSTKPEFWKSRRITSVSWDARLVLKGLESYVDDNGVGIDDIELIVTDVFPRDMFANGSETVARVSEAITELHRAGLVHRYEGERDHLLYISFWEDIQRIDKPGKGRNPRPDGTIEYRDSSIRESVANVPEVLAPGTGEQGNRGTGEQSLLSDADASDRTDELFEQLWNLWPSKQRGTRKKSGSSFRTALKSVGGTRNASTILDAAESHATIWHAWPPSEQQFVPQMVTWLNQERWTLPTPDARSVAGKVAERTEPKKTAPPEGKRWASDVINDPEWQANWGKK